MGFQNTSLGGPGRDFPPTTLGIGAQLKGPPEVRRAALETLGRRYWKPIYSYIVAAWAKSSEEAKDLTQAFLLRLLEEDALARYAPDRGSFRGYLKVLLKSFVGHQDRADGALKRGGASPRVPMAEVAEVADAGATDPEKAFDRAWRTELIDRAIAAVRARWQASGRAAEFRIYEDHDLQAPEGRPTYDQLAERAGRTPNQVEHAIFLIRGEIRAELRAELTELTADGRSLDEEWNELFGS